MSLLGIALAMPACLVPVAAGRWLLRGSLTTRVWLAAAAIEAVLLTLLAALWFGSLGHGSWWVVFGLVGLLVGNAERAPGRQWLPQLAVAVLRYLGAGALLAWLLP